MKQRNDIGSAKDQLAVVVQNAHLEAYDDIYVAGNETVKSTAANTTVGQRVINAALEKYGASKNMKFGDASIVVAQSAEGQDATVTITTRDFTETGKISIDGGTLSWNGTSGGNGGGQTVTTSTVAELAQAGTIKRWDKINYNPGTATTASINLPEGASIEGTKLASLNLPAGATLNGTIDASEASDWVVLDVTEDGDVLIMPRTVSETTLTLSGMNGYNNAIQALDAVAGIYLNPSYATTARSITVEDINKVDNCNQNLNGFSKTWNHRYGVDENLNIIDAGEENATERTYTSTATTRDYAWPAPSFGGNFWIASRCLDIQDNYCSFCVRTFGVGWLDWRRFR